MLERIVEFGSSWKSVNLKTQTLEAVTHPMNLTHVRVRASLELDSISKCTQLRDLQLPFGLPSRMRFLENLPLLESLQVYITDATCKQIACFAPQLRKLIVYVDKDCSTDGLFYLTVGLPSLKMLQLIFSPKTLVASRSEFILGMFDTNSFPLLQYLSFSVSRSWAESRQWQRVLETLRKHRKNVQISSQHRRGSFRFFDS